jgi:hypothetical protein
MCDGEISGLLEQDLVEICTETVFAITLSGLSNPNVASKTAASFLTRYRRPSQRNQTVSTQNVGTYCWRRSLVAACQLLPVIIAESAGYARRKSGVVHHAKRTLRMSTFGVRS